MTHKHEEPKVFKEQTKVVSLVLSVIFIITYQHYYGQCLKPCSQCAMHIFPLDFLLNFLTLLLNIYKTFSYNKR